MFISDTDSTESMAQSDFDYLASTSILHSFEKALSTVIETRPTDVLGTVIKSLQEQQANNTSVGGGNPVLPASDGSSARSDALAAENARLVERLAAVKAELQSACETVALLRSPKAPSTPPFDPTNPLISILLDTDSYKLSHWLQYPPNTTSMFSYLESRGGIFSHSVFFGLQYYLLRYLTRPITALDLTEAAPFAAAHGLPFNTDGWRLVIERHGGRLPVRIRAVPEGTICPIGNILMSVESTDPDCFWVVSWLETILVRLWCPITVASNGLMLRRIIEAYHRDTADGDSLASSEFSMHDFGARGVSSQETAMIAGSAHLTSFKGSDTIAGIWAANRYYGVDMSGYSIPASEHSTMTMWGRDREVAAYRNMINAYGEGSVFACVSDSYDVFNAVDTLWGGELKDDVEKMKAKLVVRPDSGDPKTVCVRLAKILEERFGSTTNSKRYRELKGVGLIQGDGVNAEVVKEVLSAFKAEGFAATNIAFGSGGSLLQKFHRDTMKFAFKCSHAVVGGEEIDVFKDPVTDPGKQSKRGRLDLVVKDGAYTTVRIPQGMEAAPGSVMETVYENGVVLKVRRCVPRSCFPIMLVWQSAFTIVFRTSLSFSDNFYTSPPQQTYTFDDIRRRILAGWRQLPDVEV